eukprot:1157582-Pelagomonas_calceolata.AAC.3
MTICSKNKSTSGPAAPGASGRAQASLMIGRSSTQGGGGNAGLTASGQSCGVCRQYRPCPSAASQAPKEAEVYLVFGAAASVQATRALLCMQFNKSMLAVRERKESVAPHEASTMDSKGKAPGPLALCERFLVVQDLMSVAVKMLGHPSMGMSC